MSVLLLNIWHEKFIEVFMHTKRIEIGRGMYMWYCTVNKECKRIREYIYIYELVNVETNYEK